MTLHVHVHLAEMEEDTCASASADLLYTRLLTAAIDVGHDFAELVWGQRIKRNQPDVRIRITRLQTNHSLEQLLLDWGWSLNWMLYTPSSIPYCSMVC